MATTKTQDFDLTQVREGLENRLKEIEPMIEEADQIKSMLGRNNTAKKTSPGRGGRPRGGGKVAEEFLRVVKEHPNGIKVADVAKELGKQANYLYRVASNLEEAGKVRQTSDGYAPVEG